MQRQLCCEEMNPLIQQNLPHLACGCLLEAGEQDLQSCDGLGSGAGSFTPQLHAGGQGWSCWEEFMGLELEVALGGLHRPCSSIPHLPFHSPWWAQTWLSC